MHSHQYHNATDAELLEHFYAEKNNEWLGILLQRYTTLLLGVCMKYLRNEEEAKDSVQHIFLKVLHELPKYKVDYFKSWLYMVAKNHCLMKLRDKGKYTVDIDTKEIIAPYEAEDKNEYIVKDKALDNMAVALHQLNTEQQQCITLFYLEKKSYQEITEQTSYTLLQVKSHIQNGKRNLKIIMERLHNNE